MNLHLHNFDSTASLKSQMRPAIFTFFAGAGFLDLGFEKAGFEVQFVNEFHKPFLEAYKFARSKMHIAPPKHGYHCGDIADILMNQESFQDSIDKARASNGLVGFVGGPPCPDFSVGGKNKGSEGENGKLSKTYIDVICKFRPDFFVFENVKGLWRTKKHRAFYDSLKAQLEEHGYTLSDRLVNAIEYGAPQDRDRIILAGVQKGIGDSKAFPWADGLRFERSILNADFWPERDKFVIRGNRSKPIMAPVELTVQHWFDRNDVRSHPNANDCFTPRAALPKFKVIDEGDDSKKCFKRLHRWRYSPTAAYGNNEVHLHPYEARRISAAEAMAVQSLPKEFCLPPNMTLTDKFKTIGNGVPFLAAFGVARSVMNCLEGSWQRD